MIDFQNSLLFISQRSPFARRVRLAFLESGIHFDVKVVDVFKPTPELTQINPLSRVPALKLSNGEVLIDSNLILQCFYGENPKNPLAPQTDRERLDIYHASSIAVGLCEKAIEYFLETLRPEDQRDPVCESELTSAMVETFKKLDPFLRDREFIGASRLTQGDLDMGAALTYLTFRYNGDWREKYLSVAKYLERLSLRSSFQATKPG